MDNCTRSPAQAPPFHLYFQPQPHGQNQCNARDLVSAKWEATKTASHKSQSCDRHGQECQLAHHGTDVVQACRNEETGMNAVHKIQDDLKLSNDAYTVALRKLDASSLANVQTFADNFESTNHRLDVLVNNAGIVAVTDVDGN